MSGDRSLQLLIEASSSSSIYCPATFPDVLVQRPQFSAESNPKFVPVVLFFFKKIHLWFTKQVLNRPKPISTSHCKRLLCSDISRCVVMVLNIHPVISQVLTVSANLWTEEYVSIAYILLLIHQNARLSRMSAAMNCFPSYIPLLEQLEHLSLLWDSGE